jgi:glutamate--cysteine ligase
LSTDVQRLSLEECRQRIESLVFRLQPSDYGRDYPKWPGLVGIEVEMLPVVQQQSGVPLTVPLFDGSKNLGQILIELAAQQDEWTCQVVPDSEPSQLHRVYLEEGDQLSFEPGGQLEISTVPYPCLSDAANRLLHLQEILRSHLHKQDIELLQMGINPWHTPEQIGLQMHKKRYHAMTEYFQRIGPYGVRMMRQTCTVQVNLDFGPDHEILTKRYMLAQLVAPIATAIFANSPIVDGKMTEKKSYRSFIWQNLDAGRTGFPQLEKLFKNPSYPMAVESYVEFALAAPVVFKTEQDYKIPHLGYSLRDWLCEVDPADRPTLEDLKVHLSLLFPEVRARGFMELRSVDCQNAYWQLIPCAFYTGLMYDNRSLDTALGLLMPLHERLREFWQKSSFGLQDPQLADLAKEIFRIASIGFRRLPACFRENCAERKVLAFGQRYTEKGRTPADELLDLYKSDSGLTVKGLLALQDDWIAGRS